MTPRWSNAVLLGTILLLLFVEPLLLGRVLYDVFVSVVLLTAVWVVSQRRRLFVVCLVFVAPVFLGRWGQYVRDSHWLTLLSAVFAMIFFALVLAAILSRVLGRTTVTLDTIAGAVCAYLILGVVWAFAFSLVELAHPGSFLVNGAVLGAPAGPPKILRQELLYLSLVTLSTVGYGDIVPVASTARMLAVLEAVTGQIYLAVLIGGLVGVHMQRPRG